ncbi:hypothetical protein [Halorussus salinisoli]|uniref:hypothetical protein n=1 Tax=Halorussus salinisoli TaxID=2558242 RepID=UPI0010C228F4|nr:hypothetical protein [Halorussus salinisoli]
MTGFDLGESATDDDPETESDETGAISETNDVPDQDEPSRDEKETDPREEPGFPFTDGLRESWYVRDETMTEFEDAVDFEAKPLLREHGVRNETGREIQDAAIQVATNNPEELARAILDVRGVDIDSDE